MATQSKNSDDTDFIALLNREAREANAYYGSEIAFKQAEFFKRYTAQPYGDEVDGRSVVTTTEVSDTINWLLPYFSKVFARSDELVTISPFKPSDQENIDDAEKYIEHIMFNDNLMPQIIKWSAQDGLIYKVGVIKTSWVDNERHAPEEYENVTPENLMEFEDDDEYEILQREVIIDNNVIEDMTDEEINVLVDKGINMMFNIKVQKTPASGRVDIECIPPERFLINRRAVDIPSATYVADRSIVYKTELVKQFPKLGKEIMMASDSEDYNDIELDQRLVERHLNDYDIYPEVEDAERKTGLLIEEYVRFDYDGDGYVELRRVLRIGDTILENIEVNESPYSSWCPRPIAHKFYGQGLAELAAPLQRINTVLMRSLLDNVMSSTRPRIAVNIDALDDQGFDQLMDQDIGAPIFFKSSVQGNMQDIVTPDMSAAALNAMEVVNQALEYRTGVTRNSQGVDPAAIAKTASGQEMLINAADVMKEEMAFQLGIMIEDVARKCLQLVCHFQDYKRQLHVAGKWIDFDPRTWSDKMSLNIHAGLNAGNKQSQASSLMQLLRIQQEILMSAGERNPWVDSSGITHTLHDLVKTTGQSDPTRYFKEAPSQEEQEAKDAAEAEQEANADPRTPEQIEAEGKVQVNMQESQAKLEMAAQKMQGDQQVQMMVAQGDSQRKDQVAANDIERANVKLSADLSLRTQQLNGELSLKKDQTFKEIELATEVKSIELALNKDLKDKEFEHKVNLSDVHIGGDASK